MNIDKVIAKESKIRLLILIVYFQPLNPKLSSKFILNFNFRLHLPKRSLVYAVKLDDLDRSIQ